MPKKVMKKIEKYKLKNEKGKRMKVYDAKSVDFEKCRYGFFFVSDWEIDDIYVKSFGPVKSYFPGPIKIYNPIVIPVM